MEGHLKNWHRSTPQGFQMPYNNLIHKGLQMFYIYQTTNGETELLYETTDEKVAQNEVERINSYLDSAGIPGWVSSAYYN